MIFKKNNNQVLPPGQYSTNSWPVLSTSRRKDISLDDWTLKIDGLVENPVELSLKDINNLLQTSQVSDFHCVTTWSMLKTSWSGVAWNEIEKLVKSMSDAKYVLQYSNDEIEYTTGTSIEELRKPNVILGLTHNGSPIPNEHGGPLRLIIPQIYAYKSAKWLCRLEFLSEKKLGFWELRGYSEQADPWKEQRYTEDDEN
jgi:DMSO/TMAO reductase YedYZ molybdopterin-dependent catalytic subunit